VWIEHWKLLRDPFAAVGAAYVAVTAHDEAVARLLATIETGQRRVVLRAGAGLGKSTVLARALAEARHPARRVVLRAAPADGPSLLAELAEGLGQRVPDGPSRAAAWRALEQAVRLCRWQRLGVILAIDDCQFLGDPADQLDLERLVHLDPHPESRLTVLQTYQTDDEGFEAPSRRWELVVRLPPLTRTESEHYLSAKLAAAGRNEPIFTTKALHRLHAVSGGTPRGLDRLAALSLMAGALRGVDRIALEVVDAAARECAAEPPVATVLSM
jgi:type II secretory pathway predicted ATPase ExeA